MLDDLKSKMRLSSLKFTGAVEQGDFPPPSKREEKRKSLRGNFADTFEIFIGHNSWFGYHILAISHYEKSFARALQGD